MKNFCLRTIIALFLYLFSNGIMAQSTGTKPDQVELMKQYPKLLKTPAGDKYKSASTVSQLLDSTIWESYDSTTGQFVVLSETVYTYDANGKASTDIFYYRINSKWIASLKNVYTYDDQGNVTSDIYYYLDEGGNWNIYENREYTYDDKGNVILDMIYWDLDDHIKQGKKYEYIYDVNGNMTFDIRFNWDITTSQWVNFGRTIYTYDANGNMTIKIYYSWYQLYDWDITPHVWMLLYKGEFQYDINGNMTLGFDSYWNDSTKQWYIDQKYEYTYDANGNMTSLNTYTVGTTSQYENYFKYENTYNVNGNITSQIYYNWYESINQWVTGNNKTFYYSEHNTTLVPMTPEREVSVYPNPASEYILFDLTAISESAIVELFDLQGKKVLEQKLSENKRISVNNLRKGLYLYRLNDSGYIYKGKILVE